MTDRFKFRIYCNMHPLGPGYLCGNELLTMDGKILASANDPTECNGDYTIEQCTGLKDKNGNLIYEGDIILTCPSRNALTKKRKVYWCNGAFFVEDAGEYEWDGKDPTPLHYFIHNDIDIEIIGNIHE